MHCEHLKKKKHKDDALNTRKDDKRKKHLYSFLVNIHVPTVHPTLVKKTSQLTNWVSVQKSISIGVY
jgi:hypothetical protein